MGPTKCEHHYAPIIRDGYASCRFLSVLDSEAEKKGSQSKQPTLSDNHFCPTELHPSANNSICFSLLDQSFSVLPNSFIG
mmetsp:Transcript_34026/g.43888  ORF Transcript_34026/g.43888 Transcript_34026/m.43888 type:complete len:80 (-) Transcript_34026:754-993(-)